MLANNAMSLECRILFVSVLAGFFFVITSITAFAAEPDANGISNIKPGEVKVAAIQCSSILGDVEANRKKITALVSQAAKNGAKIIVLPEIETTIVFTGANYTSRVKQNSIVEKYILPSIK